MTRPSLVTLALFVSVALALPSPSFARGGGHSGGSRSHSTGHSYGSGHSSGHRSTHSYRSSHSGTTGHRSTYSTVAPRDSHGRIRRSSAMKKEFEKETGYPHGRKGYVVDHIVPLKRGGSDTPSNMQWQTIEAAKAKDKME